MERIQINASAAKLRGTVAVLKIYRCNKREGGKRTMDDKGEREQEPWMIKERENMDVTKEGVSAISLPYHGCGIEKVCAASYRTEIDEEKI